MAPLLPIYFTDKERLEQTLDKLNDVTFLVSMIPRKFIISSKNLEKPATFSFFQQVWKEADQRKTRIEISKVEASSIFHFAFPPSIAAEFGI